MRPAQPIPEISTISSFSYPDRSMARIRAPSTIPLPQPGHQTWGNFLSCRRYLYISLVVSAIISSQLSANSYQLFFADFLEIKIAIKQFKSFTATGYLIIIFSQKADRCQLNATSLPTAALSLPE